MHKFVLSIGDWSGDGHGQHEDFLICSNKPVQDVREAHYNIPAKTGINIERICSQYEDCVIDENIMKQLKSLGFTIDTDPPGYITDEQMAKLWLFLLQKSDETLKLNISKEEIPTLHFYGFDEKNRHIGYVGYGLFT